MLTPDLSCLIHSSNKCCTMVWHWSSREAAVPRSASSAVHTDSPQQSWLLLELASSHGLLSQLSQPRQVWSSLRTWRSFRKNESPWKSQGFVPRRSRKGAQRLQHMSQSLWSAFGRCREGEGTHSSPSATSACLSISSLCMWLSFSLPELCSCIMYNWTFTEPKNTDSVTRVKGTWLLQ